MSCKNIMILSATPSHIQKAAARIQAGDIVAFPTETIYGLGADAGNADAVAKIYAAKQRPAINPLIVHCLDVDHAQDFAVFDEDALSLATQFWAGALTMILPLKQGHNLAPQVTAGLSTVAIRVPSHPVARALIAQSKCAIAAPSANRSGRLSPTTPLHVADSLADVVDLMILGDGQSPIGLESTIIDLSTPDCATILRAGAFDLEMIEPHIKRPVVNGFEPVDNSKVKSPGQLLRHYAPNKPLRLNAVDVIEGEGLLAFGSTKFMGIRGKGGQNGGISSLPEGAIKNLSESKDLHEAASNLFAHLHALDHADTHQSIAVMPIPEIGIGIAINERLRRAANVGKGAKT